jgi:hypothetical protein
MKRLLTTVAAVAIATVASGGLLAGFAGSAAAATPPPWEPDGNSVGGLTFYNAAGTVITGGSTSDSPIAAYVQGNTVVRAGDNKATLFGYLPVNGQVPGQWSGEALGASTPFPNAGAPASVSSTLPVETGASGDESIVTLAQDFPNNDNSSDGYKGIYQLRLRTSSTSGGGLTTTYDSADIQITGTTWSVVYSAATPATPTTTTLTTTPGSPQNHGTSVTLNAVVSPSTAAGTVQFLDGATPIGSPVTVTSGAASTSTSTLSVGAHTLGAVFTPTVPANFGASTAPTVPFSINSVPAAGTTTALSVNPTEAPAFTAVNLTANVTKTSDSSALGSGDGSVKFFDNGTSLLGSAPVGAGGVATLSYSAFTVGPHSITAQFVPTDSTVFSTSTSLAIPFTADEPTSTPDPQTLEVNIPAGTLTITTPYNPSNPFNLGTANFSPDDSAFTASAPFGDGANPQNGVTVTDTRAGDQGWTASATVTDFADPSNDLINGQNLSFTGVTPSYITGNALQSGVVASDVTSTPPGGTPYGAAASGSDGLKGGPHAFATAPAGTSTGEVFLDGVLTLNAPTSTPSGEYTATLTFTIA